MVSGLFVLFCRQWEVSGKGKKWGRRRELCIYIDPLENWSTHTHTRTVVRDWHTVHTYLCKLFLAGSVSAVVWVVVTNWCQPLPTLMNQLPDPEGRYSLLKLYSTLMSRYETIVHVKSRDECWNIIIYVVILQFILLVYCCFRLRKRQRRNQRPRNDTSRRQKKDINCCYASLSDVTGTLSLSHALCTARTLLSPQVQWLCCVL